IEELAKRSGKDEATITRAALDFAGEKNVDVGSVLAGPDLEEFEQRVGYQPPLSLKFYRAYRRIGWLGMVAPVAIITLVLLAATAWALTSAGFSSGTTTLLVLLF